MPLEFNGVWRLHPPSDGAFINEKIPEGAISDVINLIMRVATQGLRQNALEHFKSYFCSAAGAAYTWSSSEGWSETDLWTFAREAAQNSPLFIEAFYDACEDFGGGDVNRYAPDADTINELLGRHHIGYIIRPPRLETREAHTRLVEVPPAPPTLAETATETFQESLTRSEALLTQGHAREAVQESLWLLETVSTAFRGVDTGVGTIEGKYFNQIVKELRRAAPGTTLELVLNGASTVHGYLSSPTGGGVRHGLDLSEGVPIGEPEARLFCNLIRSYISFLLTSHERLSSGQRAE